MTHNVAKLPQVKDNKSHVKHILLYMCQICLTIFLTHGLPNTSQVKQTEDNCEAYVTQHVSNVTLCRCQIYSVVHLPSKLVSSYLQNLDFFSVKKLARFHSDCNFNALVLVTSCEFSQLVLCLPEQSI
jgi:hypothetical protein